MNNKRIRNLKRTRALLDTLTDLNRKSVLNALYSVSPVAWDTKAIKDQVYRQYPPDQPSVLNLFTLNMMRLYRRNPAYKVVICCMPKSGSTFLLTSLLRLEVMKFELSYLHVPYENPSFVEAELCENELDEMALLHSEMMGGNRLAHLHMKSSPYSDNMLGVYGYRPIVMRRNIFDCIVSMDDMICKGLIPGFAMARPPLKYKSMNTTDRLDYLCRMVGPWYIDFWVSWTRSKLNPLFLSYEHDVLGFDEGTAERLREFLDMGAIPLADFMQAFKLENDMDRSKARLNVGKTGRGMMIPKKARDTVHKLAKAHAGEVDFTGLL